MRIGVWIGGDTLERFVASAREAKELGFGGVWAGQIFGPDTLTCMAVAAREVPGLDWGTAVVPTYPRHPIALAMQALTVSEATGGRLTLGIGPSHQLVIEALHGLDYSKPASHTEQYLNVLVPLLRDGKASATGDQVSGRITLSAREGFGVPVLVAALAPRMLRLAGTVADGTVTWMAGPKAVEDHIVPAIRAAAAEAGRPEPRVVMALPVAVTDDPAAARAKAAEEFAVYGTLPAYQAVLAREGAENPSEVAIVGGESEVRDRLEALKGIGVTDFVAVAFTERRRTLDVVRGLL
ncbi:MAG: TIGR03564 family F420-dependent LLM class oxidoreductase [Acidimicrobiales bacterium]